MPCTIERMTDSESGDRPEDPQDPPQPERTSGLTLETCYRHPREVTGVHCTRCGRSICPDCMTAAPVGYQCPECVKEARQSSGGRRARLTIGGRSGLTRVLLVANIGMFVVEILTGAVDAFGARSGGRIVDLGALVPCLVDQGQYWRLFTVMFLHANLIHLAFNMYALYLFGNLIEDALGTLRFLGIYLLCGLLASVTSFSFSQPLGIAVGASGAIFGLLGAWVAYNYRRRGTALASANLRSALMIVAINVFLGFSIAGIDNFAHLGGLASGAAAGWLAEGFGPRNVRAYLQAAGFAALVLIGLAMTAYRVTTLDCQQLF
jgi:membrane associated rhomboid family serine protease